MALPSALVRADLQVARHAIDCSELAERAHLRVGLHPVPDLDRMGRLADLVEEPLLDIRAARGRAHLALVEEDVLRRAGDRRRDVGVVGS